MYKILIDDVFMERKSEMLGTMVLLISVATTAVVVFGVVERYLFTYTGERTIVDLRNLVFAHLRRLPMAYLHGEQTGRVMALFTTYIPEMGSLYRSTLADVLLNVLKFIAILIMLIKINLELTLLGMLFLPLFSILPAVFTKHVRSAAAQVQSDRAEISAALQESISATPEVKAFVREQWDIGRMGNAFTRLLNSRIRQRLIRTASQGGAIVVWLSVAFMFWFGGQKVLAGQMSAGLLVAFVQYFSQIALPIERFITLNNQIQIALAAADRIFHFLRDESAIEEGPPGKPLDAVKGRIRFENVSFSYDGQNPVFSKLSFSIDPGETIGIVGPSGAGKSTLVNLLLRFYNPTAGRILIDGNDIRDVSVVSLRQHIGVVFQDTFLFAASIRENIKYANAEASEEQIIEAAKAANIHNFIIKLPKGYDTEVGERGVKLSGGQRQRIAIARVFLKNPRILILDEATSSLDSESEQAIQGALESLMKGRTNLVITHRLSSVLKAERIIVLDEGKIVESGTHQQLLRNEGLYRKLYMDQFKEGTAEKNP